MLVGFILLVAQILTMTAWGETNVKKTEEGRVVLEKLSSAGLFFLRWRAYADHKKELRWMGNLAGWITLLLVCIFLAIPSSAKPVVSVYCILFMTFWLSIRIGTDVKGQMKEMLTMGAIMFCAPFVLLLLDWLQPSPRSLLDMFVAPIHVITQMGYQGFQLALVLALMGGGTVMVFTLGGILLFSIVPLFILFLMAMISKLSRNLLAWKTSRARNCVALYVLVIGPTLITLHANQFF